MNLTMKEKMLLATGNGMWHTKDLDGKLPSIHVSDGPHGLRCQSESAKHNNDSIESTCFPTASAIASSWNPEMVKKMADAIGREAFNAKVSVLLGPGINMKRSPLCGRNFEYYSEDPYLAGVLGASFVKAVEALGVGTSLKHFCGNSQETKRMTSNSMIDEKALREIYLRAFEHVVKTAHPATIMASYNRVNGSYATENSHILTDILRNEWKYQGAVISDWGACVDLTKALKAGMDLEMPDSKGFHFKPLYKDYKKGLITDEEINASSNRLIHLIQKYAVENRTRKEEYDVSSHHQLAVELECDSAVLLENDGILPLKEKMITIIGGLAKDVRFQGGGSSHIHTTKVMDAVTAFEHKGYTVQYAKGYGTEDEAVDSSLENEAVELAAKSEIVLFFGGLTDRIEGEGYDRKSLQMPKNQIELFDKIYHKNTNIIFISFGGAPYDMSFNKRVRALLHMYLGGEGVMEAVAKLVSGDVSPSGKLAETFPICIEDTPAYKNYATSSKDIMYKESIFIGYRYYDTFNLNVLYPFGYGKTYTSFKYSNLKAPKVFTGVPITITYEIENVGKCTAKEISQVYIENVSGTHMRPKKELKGFAKTEIVAHEKAIVKITLDKSAFEIYDAKRGFFVPEGDYKICVGSSVNTIHLEADIRVSGKEYKKKTPKCYQTLEGIQNITNEEFKKIYDYEFSTFDSIKKGSFTKENSLEEVAPYSVKARMLLKFAKKTIYKSYKDKPKDDPEVMMMIETATSGSMDCVFCAGGIPYRLLESIVLAANGHHIKSFFKLIRG